MNTNIKYFLAGEMNINLSLAGEMNINLSLAGEMNKKIKAFPHWGKVSAKLTDEGTL